MNVTLRLLLPPLLGTVALALYLVHERVDFISASLAVPLPIAAGWLIFCAALGIVGAVMPRAASPLATAFAVAIGCVAGFWPLAFLISEEPVPTGLISLRNLVPNILLVAAAWGALYVFPSDRTARPRSRLFSRLSVATGRALMVAMLLTFFFYAATAGIIEHNQLAPRGQSSFFAPIVDVFYGTSTIYFVLVAVMFWAMAVSLGLAVKIYRQSSARGVDPAAFDDAFESDRRFLATLIAVLPLLGFLGTILGISVSIKGLETTLTGTTQNPTDLQRLLRESLHGLSLAFETTIIGIAASAILLLIGSYLDRAISALRSSAVPGAGDERS